MLMIRSRVNDDGISYHAGCALCAGSKESQGITQHEAPVDGEAYTGRYERPALRLGYPRNPKSEHEYE